VQLASLISRFQRQSERQETGMTQPERPPNDRPALPWAHLRLQPFPQVAVRVLQSIHNENVQLHELSDLISSDPAFASEVLTVANSLLYAPRFPSSTILQAIAVLGENNLQGLCLTVAVRAYMGKSLNQPVMHHLWRHSLACALIAARLASVLELGEDSAFTCGVMHDVGRLALAVVRPAEYAATLASHVGAPASILEAERDLFGCDHCEAGSRLIANWKLPAEFETVVAGHHSATGKPGSAGLADVINQSCRIADTAGFPAFPGCERAPYPELLEELPVHLCATLPPDIESLAKEVNQKINAVESV
jgi:HD-like signal output (HDOD) protein